MELFVFWLIMAGIVAIIAHSKGLATFGWLLYGVIIWPIALVHVLVTRPAADKEIEDQVVQGRFQCPYCAEWIKREAKICRFCHNNVSADVQEDAEAEDSEILWPPPPGAPLPPRTGKGWAAPKDEPKENLDKLRVVIEDSLSDGMSEDHRRDLEAAMAADEAERRARRKTAQFQSGTLPEKETLAEPNKYPIRIVYENFEGEITSRQVEVTEVYRRGERLYVAGRCGMAEAMRNFRVDRIQELTDLNTGETVEDPTAFVSGTLANGA